MVSGPEFRISSQQNTAHLAAGTGLAPSNKETSSFASLLTRSMATQTQVNEALAGSEAPPISADKDTQLRWAAQQLETILMQELLSGMRKTVPEGGLFPQSFSTRTYQEMMDQEQAKAMAEAGGIGLGDVILRQLRG